MPRNGRMERCHLQHGFGDCDHQTVIPRSVPRKNPVGGVTKQFYFMAYMTTVAAKKFQLQFGGFLFPEKVERACLYILGNFERNCRGCRIVQPLTRLGPPMSS